MKILGKICSLRSVESGDIDTILLWENDCRLFEYGDAHVPYTREEVAAFVANQQCDISLTCQRRWIIENVEGRAIGAVDIFNCCFEESSAEIGVLIYESAERNKGYATEALEMLAEYAIQIGIRYLYVKVHEDNRQSIGLFSSVGFVRKANDGKLIYMEKDLEDFL